MKYNPLCVILKSIGLLVGGRAQFPKDRVGKTITTEVGGIYEWDTVQDADNYDKSYAKVLKVAVCAGQVQDGGFPPI